MIAIFIHFYQNEIKKNGKKLRFTTDIDEYKLNAF
jgi:hypothetical protein